MKNLFIILALILVVSISFTQAQTDTVKTDKVYMLDGSTIDGKVKTVKSDIVVFTEKETDVDYEINKSDIKVIILGNGKPMIFTAPVETKVTQSDVVTTQSTTSKTRSGTTITQTEPVVGNNDIQFSLAGLLFFSFQSWSDVETDSKFGFGISGDLFAGILFDDMYIGIGPHFGANRWSSNVYGIDMSANVNDFGIDLGTAWSGFYLTIGTGSANVNLEGRYGGQTASMDFSGIGYTCFGFGWFDGYAIGFNFVNYSKDEIENIDRLEVNVGWAF